MFELIKEKMEFAVTKRTERHGDDKVAAYDAKLTGDFPNAVLTKLDERLRGVFYGPGAQGDVEQGYFPELLFPLMGGVAWALEMARMVFRLHDVDTDDNDLVLTGKEMDKVHFDMKPGGTITLSLRVKLGQVSEEELLQLLRVDNQTIYISLHQAEVEAKPDNYEQADSLAQAPHSAEREKAESMFKPAPVITPESVVMAGAQDETEAE